MYLVIHLIVIFVGVLIAVQSVLNTKLATYVNHPLQSTLINFLVGTAFLLAINLLLKNKFPTFSQMRSIPLYLFVGGICGTIIVSSAIFLIPKIGIVVFTFGIIASQLLGSIVIEHFGILGVAVKTFNWYRAIAVVLILGGYFLINVSSTPSP